MTSEYFSLEQVSVEFGYRVDFDDAYDPALAIIADQIERGFYNHAFYQAQDIERDNPLAAYLAYERVKEAALADGNMSKARDAASRARAMRKQIRGT